MKGSNMQVFVFISVLINASQATTYMYILAQEWVGSVCQVEPSCPYMGKYDGLRWNFFTYIYYLINKGSFVNLFDLFYIKFLVNSYLSLTFYSFLKMKKLLTLILMKEFLQELSKFLREFKFINEILKIILFYLPIHGLWPNTQLTSSCGSIQYCRTDPYDSSKILQKTKDVLDIVWNGLYSDTESFRGYEWEKHGTCYPGEVSQNYFFQTAGGLAQKYNYYSILAKAGIYPDDSRQLFESDIRNAFAAVLGTNVKITFSCFKDQVTGKYLLGQLKICFDEQLQVRTCNCKLNEEDNNFDNLKNHSQYQAQPLVSCGSVFYYPEL